MGYTLNEYALATLKGERRVAGRTEEEIYGKLKLDFVPPEIRENTGEIEAAEQHRLPNLVRREDIKGDLHMHTTASDGKCSIEEMAEAARKLGHQYIAIADHSKSVTIANGLDEKRIAAHIKKLRAANATGLGIRVLVGSEVDILKDGSLDYSDELLAQFEVVVCSVHSYMNLDRAAMTERMLAAIENPYTQIIGHPTGRLLLRARGVRLRYGQGAGRSRKERRGHGMQLVPGSSGPDRRAFAHVQGTRSKSSDRHRFPQHAASAVHQAWRDHGAPGWLEAANVINTLPVDQFLAALRPKPGAAKSKQAAAKR